MINTFNFFKIFVNCMNGGVKIRKRMTILVLLLIFTILSISSVSANDADNNIAIDENNFNYSANLNSLENSLDSQSSSNDCYFGQSSDGSSEHADNGDGMGEEFLETDSDSETDDGDLDPSSDNLDNDAELKQSQLTLVNSTIEYGKNLELILSSNDVALAGENLILEINGTNHTLISDSTGKAVYKISLLPGSYEFFVYYLGNDIYAPFNKTFTLNVLNIASSFTVSSVKVMNGYYLYVYLKDANGNPINGENITLDMGSSKYTAKTSNGKAGFKIKLDPKKYSAKLSYVGNSIYSPSSNAFTLNVVKNQPSFKYGTKVQRLNYLYVYLRDGAGKAISGKKVTIKISGKKYAKTTNSNGRVSLKISKPCGKYVVKLSYGGNSIYSKAYKKYTLKVIKNKAYFEAGSSISTLSYFKAYLKNNAGKAIKNKKVTIKVGSKKYTRTTNSNGRITYYIKAPGTYKIRLYYNGNNYYAYTYKYVKLKVSKKATKVYPKTKTVIKGGYLKVYVKDSSNKAIKDQKVSITVNGKTYDEITNSKGLASLKISLKKGFYNVTIKYAGNKYYKSSSNTFNMEVILGSGLKISKKTIVLDSDLIYNTARDLKLLNDMASLLRAKGYKVIVNSKIGPNSHNNDVMNYEDVCVFSIYGGVDSGMFVDKASNWFQYYLNHNDNQIALGFLSPPVTKDLATLDWLERAHDDDYSPKNFTGLANPGLYINEEVGANYVYGSNAAQLVNNFLNYAVNGKSIGISGAS